MQEPKSNTPHMEESPVEEKTESSFSNKELDWHRLSPISVIFFLGKMLTHLVKDALPGLAPLIVIVANSDNKEWLTIIIISAIVLLVVASSILQYLFFRFVVNKDKVFIKQGVFKKQERILSFERVQNINIIQPFYFKPFSLVTLQLETAGSKANEGDLAGIKSEVAEELKQQILEKKANAVESDQILDDTSSEDSNLDLLATANLKQLVKYGVTSNGMFWFLVFLAPFMGMLDDILENWIGEENMMSAVEFLGGGLQGGIILGAIVLVTIILGMILFSILGAVTRYHNYRLTLNSDTLKRHSGLLSTHEESAKLSKIQAFVKQTNFVGKWLGVENIVLKQASGQMNQNHARAGLFVIPTRLPKESTKLLFQCLSCEENHESLKQISKRFILKNWIILSVFPVAVSIFTTIVNENAYYLLINMTLPLLWLVVRQRWKNYGYQLGQEFASFRSGFLGYRKVTFPLFKAQRVVINQSFLQKHRGLANLEIIMASDRIVIPYMPIEEAVKWLDRISYKIETTDRAWF